MTENFIYLEGVETPFSLENISNEIIKKGRKRVSASVKSFLEEVEFKLSFSYMNTQKRIEYAENSLKELSPTINNSKRINTKQLKSQLLISINFALDKENDKTVLWRSRYNTLVESIVQTYLIHFKIKFFREMIIEKQTGVNPGNIEKIKWSRGVSEFGYMMLLLVEKNYIELPTGHDAEGSYERFARVLFQTFEVTDSWSSFKDALNKERNRLSETKRVKLNDFPADFPDSSELGPLKKK